MSTLKKPRKVQKTLILLTFSVWHLNWLYNTEKTAHAGCFFIPHSFFAGVGEPNGLRLPGGRGLASPNTAVRCFGEARHENKERRKRGCASRPLRLCFRKGRQIPPPQPPAVPTPNSEGRGAVFWVKRVTKTKSNCYVLQLPPFCRQRRQNGAENHKGMQNDAKRLAAITTSLPIKEYRFLQIPTS